MVEPWDETGVPYSRVESGEIEKDSERLLLADVDGILIPGGFGLRGIEGKSIRSGMPGERHLPFWYLFGDAMCGKLKLPEV